MYVTMVFHHPTPEHREAADRLVAIRRWASEAAATEGIPRLLAVGGRDPAWTDRPDELFRLESE